MEYDRKEKRKKWSEQINLTNSCNSANSKAFVKEKETYQVVAQA